MKKICYMIPMLVWSASSHADLIDFTGGTAVRNDGTFYITDNTSHDFEGVDYYSQNGFKFDFINGEYSDPFDTSVGNYHNNGSDVFHGHAPGLNEIKVSAVNGSNFTANSFRLTTHVGESWSVNAVSADGLILETKVLPQEEWGAGTSQGSNPVIALGDGFNNVKEITFTANDSAFGIGFDDFNFVQKYLALENEIQLEPKLDIINTGIQEKANKLKKQAENKVLGYVENPSDLASDYIEFIQGVGAGELAGTASKLATSFLLTITKHPYFKNTAIASVNHSFVSEQLTDQFTKLDFKGVGKSVATGMFIDVLTSVIESEYGHKIAGASWFAMKEIVAGVNAGLTAKDKKIPYLIAFAYEQTGVLVDVIQKDIEEYGQARNDIDAAAVSEIKGQLLSFEELSGRDLFQRYYRSGTQNEADDILDNIKSEARDSLSNYLNSSNSIFNILSPDYNELATQVLEEYADDLEGKLTKSKLEIEANIFALVGAGKAGEASSLSVSATGTTLVFDLLKSSFDSSEQVQVDAESVHSSEVSIKSEIALPEPEFSIGFDGLGSSELFSGDSLNESFSVDGTAFFEDDLLVLQTHSPTLVFFDLLVPGEAVWVSFDFLATNTVFDDFLSLMVEDELIFSLSGDMFGDEWMQTGLLDISSYSGLNVTFTLGLLSPEGVESELLVDNLQFYKAGAVNQAAFTVSEPGSLVLIGMAILILLRVSKPSDASVVRI